MLFRWFHARIELDDCRNDYAEREGKAHIHHLAVAVEKVDELAVAQLGHQVEHEISHGVVYPMEQ